MRGMMWRGRDGRVICEKEIGGWKERIVNEGEDELVWVR